MVRWIKKLVKLGFAFLMLLLFLGFLWEHWSRWRAPRIHPPQGELVDIGGRNIHLVCSGSGDPTVILESGAGNLGSIPWMGVTSILGDDIRVCRYDRAGFLWSDPDPEPRSALRIAEDLHGLSDAGAISSPFVMVGHSIGGILIRVYDDRYPGEVAGFVFVDSAHPQQEERAPPEFRRPAGGGSRGALPSVLGRIGVLRLVARLGAPDRGFSHLERAVLDFAPKSMAANMAEISALDSTIAQGLRTGPLDPRPVVVLTAGQTSLSRPPGVSEEAFARFLQLKMELQRELAGLSTNSDHRVIADAGHVIQVDAPEATAEAIRDVVNAVRSGTRVEVRGQGRIEDTGGAV